MPKLSIADKFIFYWLPSAKPRIRMFNGRWYVLRPPFGSRLMALYMALAWCQSKNVRM